MVSGEIYVKKILSMRIINLVRAVVTEYNQSGGGIRYIENLQKQIIGANEDTY
jgi:hypothetical protein